MIFIVVAIAMDLFVKMIIFKTKRGFSELPFCLKHCEGMMIQRVMNEVYGRHIPKA